MIPNLRCWFSILNRLDVQQQRECNIAERHNSLVYHNAVRHSPKCFCRYFREHLAFFTIYLQILNIHSNNDVYTGRTVLKWFVHRKTFLCNPSGFAIHSDKWCVFQPHQGGTKCCTSQMRSDTMGSGMLKSLRHRVSACALADSDSNIEPDNPKAKSPPTQESYPCLRSQSCWSVWKRPHPPCDIAASKR